jgi:hypothetical protein
MLSSRGYVLQFLQPIRNCGVNLGVYPGLKQVK